MLGEAKKKEYDFYRYSLIRQESCQITGKQS